MMIRVRELREAKGLQQKELAIDLCVSQPTISDWESGRKIPSSRSTKKLADYFNVSIDYLLGRDDEKNAPAPKDGDGLDAEQVEIVKLYEKAPPALRAAALAVLKSAEGQSKAPDDAPKAE